MGCRKSISVSLPSPPRVSPAVCSWLLFPRPLLASETETDLLATLPLLLQATCPTLSRPFGQNKKDDHYEDLADQGHLYYIAIVVHSADHFLVDQLAVIVQLAKR